MAASETTPSETPPSETTPSETTPAETTPEGIPRKTPKKVRCHICRKKVGLVSIPCKCGKPVCFLHMNPHSHQCTYNHAQECRDRIVARNPKVAPRCLVPI